MGNKKTNLDESFLPMRDDDTNGISLKAALSVFPHQPWSVSLHGSGYSSHLGCRDSLCLSVFSREEAENKHSKH